MLIFGWGGNAKVLGEVGFAICPKCNNDANWQVVETSRKASVYFIPVARWDKQYFVLCPVCQHGTKLQTREEAQDLLLQALEQRENSRIATDLARRAGLLDAGHEDG